MIRPSFNLKTEASDSIRQAILETDNENLKVILRRELKKFEEAEKRLHEDEKPLVEAIRSNGISVRSVWDFVNTTESYPEAIPVLLLHLPQPYHEKTKEGIIRALAVKEAKGIAGDVLIKEYHKTAKDNFNLRWVIGNTMNTVIGPDDFEATLKIVLDESNGESRQMFVRALRKIRSEKVEQAMLQLLEDPDELIVREAVVALGIIRSPKAKSKLNRMLGRSSFLKKDVEKALKKIR